MEEQKEKWGCWFDGDEIISAIEDSKEAAIEEFANSYCCSELDSETETRNFTAMVGIGQPVLIENFLPDFDDLISHIEDQASSEHNLDDELVTMNKEERQLASAAYEAMMHTFCKEYLKQRDWNIFPDGETIIIKVVNGEYAGWEQPK